VILARLLPIPFGRRVVNSPLPVKWQIACRLETRHENIPAYRYSSGGPLRNRADAVRRYGEQTLQELD